MPTLAVEESSGEEEADPQETEGDRREETQEGTRAEEAQEAQEALSQEDSWSEEEITPGWQGHYHSSLPGIALKRNSS